MNYSNTGQFYLPEGTVGFPTFSIAFQYFELGGRGLTYSSTVMYDKHY